VFYLYLKRSQMSTSQGFIFLKKKNVNGESKWFEDGDEEND